MMMSTGSAGVRQQKLEAAVMALLKQCSIRPSRGPSVLWTVARLWQSRGVGRRRFSWWTGCTKVVGCYT